MLFLSVPAMLHARFSCFLRRKPLPLSRNLLPRRKVAQVSLVRGVAGTCQSGRHVHIAVNPTTDVRSEKREVRRFSPAGRGFLKCGLLYHARSYNSGQITACSKNKD